MVKTDSVRNAALKRANGNVQTVELQWIKGINSVRSVVRDEIPKVQNKTIRHIILHHGGSKCWKPDEKQSTYRGKECIISRDDSRVKLILIPTNEELMIARDTLAIVTGKMK